MSYNISDDDFNNLKALVLSGKSVREIYAVTNHGVNTIIRHRNEILREHHVLCGCGKDLKHQGWCKHRMQKSPERKKLMRYLANRKIYTEICIDCGGPRSNSSGLRCRKCFKIKADAKRKERAEATRQCKICEKVMLIRRNGKCWMHCESEWCERLYTFYYVEGRSRPPTVRDGKNNGLKFEFFLSDYLKRLANEKLGTKHGRSARGAFRRMGSYPHGNQQSGTRSQCRDDGEHDPAKRAG